MSFENRPTGVWYLTSPTHLSGGDLLAILELPSQPPTDFLLRLQGLAKFLGTFLELRRLSLGPLPPPSLVRTPRLNLPQLKGQLALSDKTVEVST